MKTIKFFTSILYIALLSVVVSYFTGIDPVALFFGASLAMYAINKTIPQGYAAMAVQKELWLADIVDLLFPNNEFALRSIDHTPFVLNGKTVHVPKAGAASTITRSQSSFPLSVNTRTDTDLTYDIEPYSTGAIKVANLDKYELAYDKRQSVMGSEMRNLVSKCMTGLLYNWAPTASTTYVHRTSGSTVDANLSGATGQRKAFHKSDFDAVKMAMDENDVDPNDRFALLNARHYNELINSFDTNELTGFFKMADKVKGVIGEYNGFKIGMRSFVTRYRGADDSEARVDTLASGYAADAADRKGSLIWHGDCVARAVGQTDMFESINDPLYLGDIYAFEQRMGGRILRAEGVHAIVDAVV